MVEYIIQAQTRLSFILCSLKEDLDFLSDNE